MLVATPHLGRRPLPEEAENGRARSGPALDRLLDERRGAIRRQHGRRRSHGIGGGESPHVDMARPALGLLQRRRWRRARFRKRTTDLSRRSARRSTKLITAAFTAGLLEIALARTSTSSTPRMIARERGIYDIIEQIGRQERRFQHAHPHRVITTEQKTYTASGTPLRQSIPALCVQLGPYHLDAYMDGIMLDFTHRDV